jgi:hypothetical protein
MGPAGFQRKRRVTRPPSQTKAIPHQQDPDREKVKSDMFLRGIALSAFQCRRSAGTLLLFQQAGHFAACVWCMPSHEGLAAVETPPLTFTFSSEKTCDKLVRTLRSVTRLR